MAALKEVYSPDYYKRLADALEKSLPSFSKADFFDRIFTKDFAGKELKERMRHTSIVLHGFMPAKFSEAVPVLCDTIKELNKSRQGYDRLASMFFGDYVEVYGTDDFKSSVKAMEAITQYASCEFAVRPFLMKYFERMMEQMQKWVHHKNEEVRRLASEGCRPRLPWAMAILSLKKDPSPIFPILEMLKNDPSAYVRRSVANNLNDISKDHPQLVLNIAKKWSGNNPQTDAIVKHGCRSLLKKGHGEILEHFGLNAVGLRLTNFNIHTPEVAMGGHLEFSAMIQNKNSTPKKLRLEYAIHFLKANGTLFKKVFKISERVLHAGEKITVYKKHSFKPITTRVFYPGKHKASLIINGTASAGKAFTLAI